MKDSNGKQAQVRKLAGQIANMTDEQRQRIADRLPSVVNPDGHMLTIHNTILLYMQSGKTDLTIVAGFKQWIKAGRVVRKGEKSIGGIFVPMQIKDKRQSDGNDEEPKTTTRFRIVSVFDVSQTDELAQEAA